MLRNGAVRAVMANSGGVSICALVVTIWWMRGGVPRVCSEVFPDARFIRTVLLSVVLDDRLERAC